MPDLPPNAVFAVADLWERRVWRAERWLGLTRALNVPLCLLLLVLAPEVPRSPILLLAVALAIGDLGVLALLGAAPRRSRLRAAGALATATEWAGGLGVVALCAARPAAPVPALLAVALVLTAGRYGVRGLLLGTPAALLALLARAAAQVAPLGIASPGAAARGGFGWGLLIGVATIALVGVRAFAERGVPPAPAPVVAGTLPPPSPAPAAPLSPREVAVLALLEQEEGGRPLLRKEIARRLGVSEETIKTHLRRLARKLDAEEASREAILRAARRRALAGMGSGEGDNE